MSRIAFVGLGSMGLPMATRLLAAGHSVTVHNRTPARASRLLEAGARWADTPRDAAEGSDAVFTMLSDDDASRAVWSGPDGVLSASLDDPRLAVECSTVSHEWSTELAGLAAAHGLRYLDCPVTGLPHDAADGRLTLLVGAEATDLELARPLLEAVSDRILHFGQVGAGTTYKLLVNLMGAVQIAAVAEGLAVAEAAGLDPDLVTEAIATGQAASPQVVRNSHRMAEGNHTDPVTFSGRLRHKDAAYGVRLAESLGVRAPLGRAALRNLDELLAAGLGDLNESSVIEIARGTGAPPHGW